MLIGAALCILMQLGAVWCNLGCLVHLSAAWADWCSLVLIGAAWCSLVELGEVWCTLVQLGADWCCLVQVGVVWCRLVQLSAT